MICPSLKFALLACVLVCAAPLAADHLTREAKLIASDLDKSQVGRALAIHGTTVAAGAPSDRSVYVFDLGPSGWMQTAKIVSTAGSSSAEFGWSVALQGDRLVVGDRLEHTNGYRSGAAYIYGRTPTGWVLERRLSASDSRPSAEFGSEVAIDHDRVVVAAEDGETVYVFRRSGTAWIEEARLKAYDGFDQSFARSIAIRDDLLVIGAPVQQGAGGGYGAAYIYRRTGFDWFPEQKLVAPDTTNRFGRSVGLGNDLIAVGATVDGPSGSVFLFKRVNSVWVEVDKLKGDDSEFQDNFALRLALDGDTLLVGAHRDDDNGKESGSAYLFRYDGTQWTQHQKFVASDGRKNEFFGDAVALHQDRVAVGAPWVDVAGQTEAGAVYIYDGSDGANAPPVPDAGGNTVTECDAPGIAAVTLNGSSSTDPDSTPGTNDDIVSFEWTEDFNSPSEHSLGEGEIVSTALPLGDHGVTLKVSDTFRHYRRDTVIKTVSDTLQPFGEIVAPAQGICVGSSGLPVVLEDDVEDVCDPDFKRVYDPPFRPESKIVSENVSSLDGFGASLAFDGSRFLVGAPTDDGQEPVSGAAFVFRRDDLEWIEEAKFKAEDAARLDRFGTAVALSGDLAVVGAPQDDHPIFDEGSAYVFRRGPSGWVQEAKLVADDAAPGVRFGSSVGTDGEWIVVGATFDRQVASAAGAAYVFRRDETGWVQHAKLVASDAHGGAHLGISVGISEDVIVAGASGASGAATRAGAVYVFRNGPQGWLEEQKLIAGDGMLNDALGWNVSVHGDLVAAVALWRDTPGAVDSGATVVFRWDGARWTQEAELVTSDAAYRDAMAVASVEGDVVVAGVASKDRNDISRNVGAAYVFRKIEGLWIETEKLLASDGFSENKFGFSVALHGATFLTGAPGAGSRGAVYANDLNDGYSRHGDYLVELTSIDASRNEGLAHAAFTIDLTAPEVRFVESTGTFVRFEADDEDEAAGGVVHERLYVQRCLLLDGSTFGDGDGLLSDEYLDLGQMNLCPLYEDCGIIALKSPTVRIEATDCGGNTAAASGTVHLRTWIQPAHCGDRR